MSHSQGHVAGISMGRFIKRLRMCPIVGHMAEIIVLFEFKWLWWSLIMGHLARVEF